MVAWFDEKEKWVVKWRAKKEEAVYELTQSLLFQQPYKDSNQDRLYYEEAFRGGVVFSSVAVDKVPIFVLPWVRKNS